MSPDRRRFLTTSAATLAVAATGSELVATLSPCRRPGAPKPKSRPVAPTASPSPPTRSGSSATSDLRDIEKCIDLAAEMGFDGVEILHRQMEHEDNAYSAAAQAAGVPARP